MLIRDFPDLKEAFGSYNQAALALGMSRSGLHNAMKRGRLPATQYLRQSAVLKSHGHKAEATLWAFAEADQREAAR